MFLDTLDGTLTPGVAVAAWNVALRVEDSGPKFILNLAETHVALNASGSI
jgi:hypothetical protein